MIGPDQKLAYTLPEAVQASGFSRATLYRYHHAGSITMRKAGRTTLIAAEDLQALIASLPELPRHAA